MSNLRDLMHAAIDGDLSCEERFEFEQLLAADPAASALYIELCSLSTAMRSLPLIDIPSNLGHTLRETAKPYYLTNNEITHNEARADSSVLLPFLQKIKSRLVIKGTAFMNTQDKNSFGRQKVWAIVGILAIVVGVVGYLDLGSENSYLSGAITQADRYRDSNISADDVVLGDDDVAQLLQSDAFIALIEDESFSQLMSDAAFVDLMANREFRALMANRQAQQLMADRRFQGLMQDARFANLMADRRMQELMADAKFESLMANGAFADLMSDARNVELMSNAAFQQLMANRGFQNLMADRRFSGLMSQARVLNLMADRRMASLMADGRMARLMTDARVTRAMQDARASRAYSGEARATQ